MRGLQNVAARAGRVAGRRTTAATHTPTPTLTPTSAAAASPFHSSSRNNARVLATDGVDDSCIKIFEERGHKVDLLETMSEADLCKVIGEYDGLVVRSATKVTPEVIKHAKKMRVIGRAGVGYDNINVKEATQKGIMVMNTPGGNTISTAQLALSLLASMARKIPQADASVKTGKWDKKSFTGVELLGKTLGIVGCGRIGQVVSTGAKAIGMNVIGYDPVMSSEEFVRAGIAQVSLTDIWAKCDFITFHTPLTPQTKDMLNDETLAMCKAGVQLINCARGGIINEAALLRALQSGHVAGAALDVFTSEPPSKDSSLAELIAHPNLICTPHLGASTDEAQLNVAKDVAVQMSDAFDEQVGIHANDYYFSVVNAGYLASSTLPHMPPFVSLAKTMGAMQAQVSTGSPVKSITVKTMGAREVDLTTRNARQLLEACVLKGFLKHHLKGKNTDLTPDLISSPSIAKDLGIEFSSSTDYDSSSDTAGFSNLIGVETRYEDGSVCSITGSVFGSVPHIVKVDHLLTNFSPEGKHSILTFRNEDKPGAISEVLAILSRESVNVASLNMARDASSLQAQCFIFLDDDISDGALSALRGLSTLKNVARIRLA